jgi:hypothetical protein
LERGDLLGSGMVPGVGGFASDEGAPVADFMAGVFGSDGDNM